MGCSIKKVRLENDPKKIPVMGVMGAFVFAAQMINFTIPGTGSSGHLCFYHLTALIIIWETLRFVQSSADSSRGNSFCPFSAAFTFHQTAAL